MNKPFARKWSNAPEVGIPEPPSVLCDTDSLWLAYQVKDDRYALVKFSGVIDHWLSPINDEGIGKHPYAHAGLGWYTFHEIENSNETQCWQALKVRHWVITFKDNTLDVIARDVEVLSDQIQATVSLYALLSFVGKAYISHADMQNQNTPWDEKRLIAVKEQYEVIRREALFLNRDGNLSEAIAKAMQALNFLENQQEYLGYYYPAAIDLATFYGLSGEWSLAEPILEKCWKVRERVHGQKHKDTATALMLLGSAKCKLQKYSEAEVMIRASVAIREEVFGSSHPEVSVALINLAAVLDKTDRVTEANELRNRAERIGLPHSFDRGYSC